MRADGDGWVRCDAGHRHWGRHGAAGLLARWRSPDGVRHVLLAQRASWAHEGGTWALPGGARDSAETWVQAALREAREEVDLDPALVAVRTSYLDDHGGWRYVTVVADVAEPAAVRAAMETTAVTWVAEPSVEALALHPGFALAWPHLRALP